MTALGDLTSKLQRVCEKSSAAYGMYWALLPAEGELYEPMITVQAHYDMPEYVAALQKSGHSHTFAAKCYGAVYCAGDDLPGQVLCTGRAAVTPDCTSDESFLRPLMAKDFEIRSIMCIPWNGGVIEIGSTQIWQVAPDIDTVLSEDLPAKEGTSPGGLPRSQSRPRMGGA